MVFFTEPHRKDIELLVAGEHGIESTEIAKGLLDHLCPRIDEDPMHGGSGTAELLRAIGSEQQAQRVFTLRFLVQLADDKAQVIDAAVGSLRTGACFERSGIASAHYARQHAHFEKR